MVEGLKQKKCFDGEEHDIENVESNSHRIVYRCTQCGIRMDYIKDYTPEDIVGEETPSGF